MNISLHQIQNVIRAYGQRVERRGVARLRPTVPQSVPDSITISSEAKNRQIADKVASEIVSRVTGQPQGVKEDLMNSGLFERLGSELGGEIDVLADRDRKGSFKFKVIDPEKGEVIKELNTEDIQKVIGRLYDKIESRVA
jgi:hypothetical protein